MNEIIKWHLYIMRRASAAQPFGLVATSAPCYGGGRTAESCLEAHEAPSATEQRKICRLHNVNAE
eukprot:scaffold213387_cov25-Prasinocladus_malaysianus.AAC.1